MRRSTSINLSLFIAGVLIFSVPKIFAETCAKNIAFEIFEGVVLIPDDFTCMVAKGNKAVMFSKNLQPSKTPSGYGGVDFIAIGSLKGGEFQKVRPKKDIYRIIEQLKIEDLHVEIWTPKKDMPYENILYITVITNNQEFLLVGSQDLLFWKKILDSHRGQLPDSNTVYFRASFPSDNGYCTTWGCDSTIQSLSLEDDGDIFIGTNADVKMANCKPKSNVYLTLKPEVGSRRKSYSKLLMYMLKNTPIVFKVLEGSSNCQIESIELTEQDWTAPEVPAQ